MNKYRWSLALAAVVVLVFALLLVARRPEPLPNPNGYDDFVAAGNMVVGKPGDVATNDPAALAAFAAQNTGVAARVRAGLTHESHLAVALNPEWIGTHLKELVAVKKAANALQLLARHQESEGRLAEAVTLQLDRLRLALAGARCGVLIDYDVCTAVELGALQDLQKLTDRLDAALCHQVVKSLRDSETTRETRENALHRQHQWAWLGSGWWQSWNGIRGMAKDVFRLTNDALNPTNSTTTKEGKILRLRHDLSLALARRAFTLEQGHPPASDAELVPAYLPALPPVAPPAK